MLVLGGASDCAAVDPSAYTANLPIKQDPEFDPVNAEIIT